MWATRYFEAVRTKLAEAEEANATALTAAASALAEALASEHLIYAFGAGHSALLVMDIFYRAGGFVPVQPSFSEKILLDLTPVTETTRWEKTEGWAGDLVREYGVGSGDVLIAISTSGPECRAHRCGSGGAGGRGHRRGAHLRRLRELASRVAFVGKATSRRRRYRPGQSGQSRRRGAGAPGARAARGAAFYGAWLGPAAGGNGSGDRGSALARGLTPPVFRSSNLPGGPEHNEALFARLREIGCSICEKPSRLPALQLLLQLRDLLRERPHGAHQFRQSAGGGVYAQLLVVGTGRRADHDLTGRDVLHDGRARGPGSALPYGGMVGYPHLPRQNHAVPNRRTSRKLRPGRRRGNGARP